MREQCEKALGGVNDLTKDLRDRTEDIERNNIRDGETFSNMEGGRLDLLEAQSKLETRESQIRKVRSNLDDAVTSLCIRHQEGRRGEPEGAGIDGHGAEWRLYSLLGGRRDLGQRLRADDR